jgi:hypothetical protein
MIPGIYKQDFDKIKQVAWQNLMVLKRDLQSAANAGL